MDDPIFFESFKCVNEVILASSIVAGGGRGRGHVPLLRRSVGKFRKFEILSAQGRIQPSSDRGARMTKFHTKFPKQFF